MRQDGTEGSHGHTKRVAKVSPSNDGNVIPWRYSPNVPQSRRMEDTTTKHPKKPFGVQKLTITRGRARRNLRTHVEWREAKKKQTDSERKRAKSARARLSRGRQGQYKGRWDNWADGGRVDKSGTRTANATKCGGGTNKVKTRKFKGQSLR